MAIKQKGGGYWLARYPLALPGKEEGGATSDPTLQFGRGKKSRRLIADR
jgi:hypothetical protein